MIVLLIRHAKTQSGWPDFSRELLPEGRERCRVNALWMAEQKWIPERLLHSPARRTTQTAELMAQQWPWGACQVEEADLYEADYRAYLRAIQDAAVQVLAVVGHNHEIGHLAYSWSECLIDQFKPGAIAAFEWDEKKGPIAQTGPLNLLGQWP
ncbi:MAG: SixA phosphatase family protein [Bacteroidia bacterium]